MTNKEIAHNADLAEEVFIPGLMACKMMVYVHIMDYTTSTDSAEYTEWKFLDSLECRVFLCHPYNDSIFESRYATKLAQNADILEDEINAICL